MCLGKIKISNNQLLTFQLHVVAYDYMNYSSIGEAMKSPMGLAVLGTLYTVSILGS